MSKFDADKMLADAYKEIAKARKQQKPSKEMSDLVKKIGNPTNLAKIYDGGK